MAERSQYQYTPVVGPVWGEPVAEKLAWLPSVQQPARTLASGRLGDFAQPPFEALYKPERLEWAPADRYAGRAIPFSLRRDFGLAPLPPNARFPDWLPGGQQPARGIPLGRLGDFARPEFEALYKPERLEWQPKDFYRGQALAKASYDSTVLVQLVTAAAFDPQTLDWMPRGIAPQTSLERRRLGDFQQPPFDSLFKPEGLQWTPADRYFGHQPARVLNDWSVLVQLVTTPAYDPQNLEWQPRDRYIGRSPARALADWSVYQGDSIPEPPAPPIVLPRPAGGDSGTRRLRRRPLHYWEAAKLRQMAQREVEESLTEELAYAEATLPRSRDDFYDRINHIKEIGRRLDSIRVYRDLARRVESVVARMEETRITVLADTSEEDEINDLIQFL